jgi:hypothetical protein
MNLNMQVMDGEETIVVVGDDNIRIVIKNNQTGGEWYTILRPWQARVLGETLINVAKEI